MRHQSAWLGLDPKCPHCSQPIDRSIYWKSRIACGACGSFVADSNTYRALVIGALYLATMLLYPLGIATVVIGDLIVIWLGARHLRLSVVPGEATLNQRQEDPGKYPRADHD